MGRRTHLLIVAGMGTAMLAGCVTPPQGPVSFTKEALDPAAGSLAVGVAVEAVRIVRRRL